MNPTRFDNIFYYGKGLITKNLIPGKKFFDEELVRDSGIEFREWDPKRSKLGAAIMKGISQIAIRKGSVVLYLGASHGYTPSFVSDIVEDGFIFAVDIGPRVLRDLVFMCEQRKNMTPILANANQPNEYVGRVSQVDVIFQDIAQRNQTEIFLKNMDLFLKPEGFGLLVIKARSVDVTKHPKEIFRMVRTELEKNVAIVDYKDLEPYEKDHCIFVCKRK